MLLLCCLPGEAEINSRLLAVVNNLPCHPQVEVLKNAADLGPRLQQPRPQCLLCLALAPSGEDLARLLDVAPLLQGIPLVLVLPDEQPATLAQAHRLRARYLTSLQRPEAPQMIAAVVGRMIEKYDRSWETQQAC
ncbi:MAG: hypothetical protein HY910_05250 [Desulfarculus sp.]|nr:hypothetical protein [Desulfarculus sp.]